MVGGTVVRWQLLIGSSKQGADGGFEQSANFPRVGRKVPKKMASVFLKAWFPFSLGHCGQLFSDRADSLVSAGGGRFNLFITQLNLCHSVGFTDTEISQQLLFSLQIQFMHLYWRLRLVLSKTLCGESLLYIQSSMHISTKSMQYTIAFLASHLRIHWCSALDREFCAMNVNIVQFLYLPSYLSSSLHE